MIAQRLIIMAVSLTLVKYLQAWTAYRLGDPTPKTNGRLSLNPIMHIDVFGTLLLPLITLLISGGISVFGYGKSLSLNPYHLKRLRRDIRILGAVPSAAHLLLAIIALAFLSLGISFLQEFFLFAVWANTMLALINIIPIPPLEGAKVMASFLPYNFSRNYLKLKPYGFFLIGLLFFSGILQKNVLAMTSLIVSGAFGLSTAV
jgi:Zn-dependent protease